MAVGRFWWVLTRVTSADREDDLADVHTSDGPVWLAEGTTHSGLQSIGTSARQHLVDADDVVWMGADAEVETFLSGDFDQVSSKSVLVSVASPVTDIASLSYVLVGADTRGFESLGAQLLILVGDQMHTAWEFVNVGALAAEIEDADLRVWHTAVETRLRVWLCRVIWSVRSSHQFLLIIAEGG